MTPELIIEAARLKIVPFTESYLTDSYVGWLNDPETMRYSDQRHRRHTLESCSNYFHSFAGTTNDFWAILLLGEECKHIGNITTYVDPAHSVADISILIGDKLAKGRGYGSEAFQVMCDYLFEDRNIRKITVGTLSTNMPMLSVARKAKMIEDGRRIEHCLFEGKEVDVVHFALFRKCSNVNMAKIAGC